MANDKDFIVKNAVEVGGSVKTTVGTLTSGSEGYYLAGASYDSVSFSVSSQDSNSRAFYIKSDGTKFWMTGSLTDTVYEYTMSTAWDLSTASYSSTSFSVASQDLNPSGLFFKSDGTKMYITGLSNDAAFQYSLSTAWDISTASYDSVSFSLSSQDTNPYSITFKPDGTAFWITGKSGNDVNEYTLSTAWDISTASYSQTASFISEEATPHSASFNSDGTKMYIVGFTSDTVFEYDLSTAYDISTATYNSVSFDVSFQDIGPNAIWWKSDGTKMYLLGGGNDTIYQYSTVLNTETLDLSTGNYFNDTLADNTKYIFSNAGAVQSFTLELGTGNGTTGFDLASTTYNDVKFNTQTVDDILYDIRFKPDGLKMYAAIDQYVYQFTLSTAWDVSTATYDNLSFAAGTQDGDIRGLEFKYTDGTKMYLLGSNSDTIYQYSLSTAWDVSTASYDSVSIAIPGGETNPNSIRFNDDGTKLFFVGHTNDAVRNFNLTTAWDLSTYGLYSVSFSTVNETVNPRGLDFNTDGTKMFVTSTTNPPTIFQYSLSTAYDLDTVTYDSVSFDISDRTGASTHYGFTFGDSGKKMYLPVYVSSGNDYVYQYDSTAIAQITWPTEIQWSGGTAPSLSGLNTTDYFTFTTEDGGTSYVGVKTADNLS